ncbi:MAG: helix-turn-helix transcriptional regulator [Nitrospirae bacterium]|nr:helix-turn-helix transcriptional regulator [Nitrospirota bacterium]MBF0542408.1 helix-turn-helix transcriptional regulator [Nitrospirota bacterium]
MNIGKNIKFYRNKLHISQKDLAYKIGVLPKQLSFIENNNEEPSITQLKKISEVLNIPVTYFFIEEKSENSNYPELHSIEKRLKKLAITLSCEAVNSKC